MKDSENIIADLFQYIIAMKLFMIILRYFSSFFIFQKIEFKKPKRLGL